jgi:malonyl-CoA O-methyltransferase
LQQCALLTSSFCLQWLRQPDLRLRHWARALAAGGWLVLAVPVLGSFPQWHQAAARAEVPCTALPLPPADTLISAASSELELIHCRRLWFSRHYGPGGRTFLQHLRRLGAGNSSQPPLSPSQWRRLLDCWPSTSLVSWQILLLIGRRIPH